MKFDVLVSGAEVDTAWKMLKMVGPTPELPFAANLFK
jgi:hypothetical protein